MKTYIHKVKIKIPVVYNTYINIKNIRYMKCKLKIIVIHKILTKY